MVAELLISIHALRAERDVLTSVKFPGINLFQSTRSVRSATYHYSHIFSILLFQSTRSVRSATMVMQMVGKGIPISIHALRAERDGWQ